MRGSVVFLFREDKKRGLATNSLRTEHLLSFSPNVTHYTANHGLIINKSRERNYVSKSTNQFFRSPSFSGREDVRTGADLSEADAGEQIGGESSAARGRFFK